MVEVPSVTLLYFTHIMFELINLSIVQERVIKTILFVTSILPHICRPLLIVSTSAFISLWETKFSRLAASINIVVYNGEKDVRKSIRDLEFCDDGSVMFQVLLSHHDAIVEVTLFC